MPPTCATCAAAAALPQARSQSLGEEIANSVSHGVALLAALVAAPFLVVAAARRRREYRGDKHFCGDHGAALPYVDAVPRAAGPAHEKVFQILDHGAIYLLIAGTYTPFTLGVLRGPWGWTLFGLVWAMALAGIIVKAMAGIRYPRLSTVLYVAMGWIAVVAIKPMWQLMPGWGLFWLLAGGAAYTLGVAFCDR